MASRLRLAVTRLHRRLRQQSSGDLTPSQASALASIDRLGSPTLGELAARESVQPPSLTRIVAASRSAVWCRGWSIRRTAGWPGLPRPLPGWRSSSSAVRSANAYLVRRLHELPAEGRASLGALTALARASRRGG